MIYSSFSGTAYRPASHALLMALKPLLESYNVLDTKKQIPWYIPSVCSKSLSLMLW